MALKNKTNIIIIAAFLIVILFIIFIPYYRNYIAPFNRTIITVDGINIPMKYFLMRTRLSSSDPLSMLQALTDEQLVKLAAPEYDININDDDVDKALKEIAGNGDSNISDVEFKEWYRQQLNNSKMSDSQYRDLVKTNLLTNRLHFYLADKTPDKAEQVHLHIIVTQTYEEAQKAAARLNAGEKFARVAKEMSIDQLSRTKGGDLGWLPPAVSIFAEQIASLEINKESVPMPYFDKTASSYNTGEAKKPQAYYILKISEKEKDRQLSDEHLRLFKEKALEFWLQEEIKKHNVKYNFSSEIYAWINWQLQKQ